MLCRIKLCVTLLLSLICVAGTAQVNSDKTSREDFKLKLAVDGDNYYETDIKAGPYIVGQDVLQIYPTEKVLLEVEETNGVIKSIKVVKENINPTKTIEVSFMQNTEGKKHQLMLLSIKNPFDMELKYRASIFLMKEKKWEFTNVLPIMGGLFSYETWPDIIVTIALDKWELLNKPYSIKGK
ncbi:MAG: hypothetical protein WCG87_11005 [Bacteroidota bacterium]